VSVDGTPITGSDDLGGAMRSHEPGDKVRIVVERDGTRRTLTVTLGRRGG
jgi:S1-C subfamily serine protease